MMRSQSEASREAGDGTTPSGVPTKPWDRKAEESAQAYGAFCSYLGAGADRSLGGTARALHRNTSLLKRWSSRHQWRQRAAAWDEEQRRDRAARVDASEVAYERRLRNAEQLEKVAMAGLRSLLVRDADSGELRFDRRLKPAEIASLIRVACQMMPTPPVPEAGEEGEDDGLGNLSDVDLHALHSMLREEQEDDQQSPEEAAQDDGAG